MPERVKLPDPGNIVTLPWGFSYRTLRDKVIGGLRGKLCQ